MYFRNCVLGLLAVALMHAAVEAQTYSQQGARRGAVAGAVVGGIVGARNDRPALGIIVGGVSGALIGKAVGERRDAEFHQQYYGNQRYYNQGFGNQGYYNQGYGNYNQGYGSQYFPSGSPNYRGYPLQQYPSNGVHGPTHSGTVVYPQSSVTPAYQPQAALGQPIQAQPYQTNYPVQPPVPYVPPGTSFQSAPILQYNGPHIPPRNIIIEQPQPLPFLQPYSQAHPHGW